MERQTLKSIKLPFIGDSSDAAQLHYGSSDWLAEGFGFWACCGAHPSTAAKKTMPQTAFNGILVRWSTLCQKLLNGTALSRLNAQSIRALLVRDSEPA